MAKIKTIDQLHTYVRSGVVVGIQSRTVTQTRTETSGGGGFLHQGSGYIAAPTTTVSSSTMEKLRMHLRSDDGPEFEVEVENLGFGVREGHRVTVVYAGDEMSRGAYPMAIVNHSTRERAVLKERLDLLVKGLNAGLGCLLLILAPLVGMPFGLVVIAGLLFIPAKVFGEAFIDKLALMGDVPTFFLAAFIPFAAVFLVLFGIVRRKSRLRQQIVARLWALMEQSVATERSRVDVG